MEPKPIWCGKIPWRKERREWWMGQVLKAGEMSYSTSLRLTIQIASGVLWQEFLLRIWGQSKWESGGTGYAFVRQRCAVLSHFSHVWLICDPVDCSPPGSSLHGNLQAKLLSGLPFPPPGDLPDPGIEPASPTSVGWGWGGSFTISVTWEADLGSYSACFLRSHFLHSQQFSLSCLFNWRKYFYFHFLLSQVSY